MNTLDIANQCIGAALLPNGDIDVLKLREAVSEAVHHASAGYYAAGDLAIIEKAKAADKFGVVFYYEGRLSAGTFRPKFSESEQPMAHERVGFFTYAETLLPKAEVPA